jgi:2-polyprenyl-6-methoxyphenol hydroxylase-like FAD-dependent oxidoreductase
MRSAGELDVDLVVAADGIGSASRPALFPGHPGLRYAGFTTWRLLTGPATGQVPMAESWGRGTVFGVMPLPDGRVYCYAAAPADPSARRRRKPVTGSPGGLRLPVRPASAVARPGEQVREDARVASVDIDDLDTA